ncbi:MAG: four helix bundle protein [Crocinitomicaceae bacterium]
MKENIILTKSYNFSLKIIPMIWKIQKEQREFVLSNQLYRSATSIGANAEEAIGGISRKDFKAKLSISYKEARESKYWLRLMKDTHLIDKETAKELIGECDEILKILFTIIRSSS